MNDFPTKDAFFAPGAESVGVTRTAQRAFYDAVRQLPGARARAALVLAADAATPTQGTHTIDTEGAAASDDLKWLLQTNLPDGALLYIRSADNARDVVVKHAAGGAGQIILADGADFTLADTTMGLFLERVGTTWVEVERSYGGNKAAEKTFLGLATAALLDAAQNWTKAQRGAPVELIDGATITPDFSAANNYSLVLGGNRLLGVPTGMAAGQGGRIEIRQDQTGGWLLSFAWPWGTSGGTAQTLSTPGCTLDKLFYDVGVYATSTVTITIAAPGVVTWNNHGLKTGQKIQLTTTGALLTGLSADTTYYVIVIDANSFWLATSLANAAAGTKIDTSGAQNGVHTAVAAEITYTIVKGIP